MLEKQNTELRKYINSNNELEKFAYRTSHDLRAPLRSLISFSNLLVSNREANLTPKQLKFIDYIHKNGKLMDGLIKGILAYSRVNATAIKKEKIDLGHLLDQIELMLFDNIDNLNAKIERHLSAKVIYADKVKLKQLFLNLISNALKFSRSKPEPLISITSKSDDQTITFSVKDNGIGMKDEYMHKIFDVFERLHTDASYSGSGIGLSTCKQIVLQHGGKIWVESEEHVGSTFFFTVPNAVNEINKPSS